MCSCQGGLAERHCWLMAGMPRHPWPKGLRPRLPSADKSQPSKAPDTQNGPWTHIRPIPCSGSNLFLTVAVRKAWRLVPLGWCGHEIFEGGWSEAGAAPPRVTRPGHMAEPQTFHSWQPQKRPTADILQKCKSLTTITRMFRKGWAGSN